MLKMNEQNFNIEFTEINLKQRLFEGKNIITVDCDCHFLPKAYNDKLIFGDINFSFDSDSLNKLSDLDSLKIATDIKVSIQLSVNGDWENNTYYDGKIKFKKLDNNRIDYELTSKQGKIDIKDKAFILSLYSTSSTKESLDKNFLMSDFYDVPIIKQLSNRTILKYSVKN